MTSGLAREPNGPPDHSVGPVSGWEQKVLTALPQTTYANGVPVSSAGAKTVLAEAFETGDDVDAIVERHGLRQVSDTGALEAVVDEAIAENPGLAEQFRAGKDGVINALVGHVMKRTKGAANPAVETMWLLQRLPVCACAPVSNRRP